MAVTDNKLVVGYSSGYICWLDLRTGMIKDCLRFNDSDISHVRKKFILKQKDLNFFIFS